MLSDFQRWVNPNGYLADPDRLTAALLAHALPVALILESFFPVESGAGDVGESFNFFCVNFWTWNFTLRFPLFLPRPSLTSAVYFLLNLPLLGCCQSPTHIWSCAFSIVRRSPFLLASSLVLLHLWLTSSSRWFTDLARIYCLGHAPLPPHFSNSFLNWEHRWFPGFYIGFSTAIHTQFCTEHLLVNWTFLINVYLIWFIYTNQCTLPDKKATKTSLFHWTAFSFAYSTFTCHLTVILFL